MYRTLILFYMGLELGILHNEKNVNETEKRVLTDVFERRGKGQSTWCVQVLRSPKEAFAAPMQSWRERCEKCVCLQGDYVEK